MVVREGVLGTVVGPSHSDSQHRVTVSFSHREDSSRNRLNCVVNEIKLRLVVANWFFSLCRYMFFQFGGWHHFKGLEFWLELVYTVHSSTWISNAVHLVVILLHLLPWKGSSMYWIREMVGKHTEKSLILKHWNGKKHCTIYNVYTYFSDIYIYILHICIIFWPTNFHVYFELAVLQKGHDSRGCWAS